MGAGYQAEGGPKTHPLWHETNRLTKTAGLTYKCGWYRT
jgi:hypothetical protein